MPAYQTAQFAYQGDGLFAYQGDLLDTSRPEYHYPAERTNYTWAPGRVTAPKDGPYLIGSVYRARGRR